MNQPIKLDCYIVSGWKGLPVINTPTYWAYSLVIKKNEYGPKNHIHSMSIILTSEWAQKARVFFTGNPFGLVSSNNLAYWCCELTHFALEIVGLLPLLSESNTLAY
jgi:hypothetical protein